LFTCGEWHNNHHAFPNAAIHSFQWWQLDMGGLVIQLLEKLGLVWDLKMPTDKMIAAKKRKVSATEAIN
jgi:stearoyl-CoA desaturase (delta-9 desaturase)